MKECTQGTKLKKVGGRRRQWITQDDLKPPVSETMLLLARMKNEGHSWRSLAEEISDLIPNGRVSHSVVRRVTLGHCKSAQIDYALGIRVKPPPVPIEPCPDCGRIHTRHKQCTHRPPPTGKKRFSFWVDEADIERARATVDSHPGGRTAWLLEHID